jgi:hypothetical protein
LKMTTALARQIFQLLISEILKSDLFSRNWKMSYADPSSRFSTQMQIILFLSHSEKWQNGKRKKCNCLETKGLKAPEYQHFSTELKWQWWSRADVTFKGFSSFTSLIGKVVTFFVFCLAVGA